MNATTKTPFSVTDGLKNRAHEKLGHVYVALTSAAAWNGDHPESILIEEFGTYLGTESLGGYDCPSGYYVTYKINPLDDGRPVARRTAASFEKNISEAFKWADSTYPTITRASTPDGSVTVYIGT